MVKAIGFTGTQEGMTKEQEAVVNSLIIKEIAMRAVHGGCVGADTQFHQICLQRRLQIIVWPSNKKDKQGQWPGAFLVHPEMEPLKRNPFIVNASSVLIVAPKEYEEVIRSGTWTTYRRAKYRGIPRWIVFPDGSRRREGGNGS